VTEFNEYQLHVFINIVEKLKKDDGLGQQDNLNLITELEEKLKAELAQLQQEKALLEAEDKIRETIRQQVMEL
jgi:hypothetical protein